MVHRAREHPEIVGQRHVLRLLAKRGCAVFQRHDVESAFIGTSHRRLDAAVRQEASQRHSSYSLAAQDEIEIGRGKGIKAAFSLDNDILGMWREGVNDGRAPRTFAKGLLVDYTLQNSVRGTGQLAITL